MGRSLCFPNAGFANQLRELEENPLEIPTDEEELAKILEDRTVETPTVEVESLPNTTLQAFIDIGIVKAAESPKKNPMPK